MDDLFLWSRLTDARLVDGTALIASVREGRWLVAAAVDIERLGAAPAYSGRRRWSRPCRAVPTRDREWGWLTGRVEPAGLALAPGAIVEPLWTSSDRPDPHRPVDFDVDPPQARGPVFLHVRWRVHGLPQPARIERTLFRLTLVLITVYLISLVGARNPAS